MYRAAIITPVGHLEFVVRDGETIRFVDMFYRDEAALYSTEAEALEAAANAVAAYGLEPVRGRNYSALEAAQDRVTRP